MQDICSQAVQGRDVLAICDSSSINLDAHRGRITDFSGLGPIEYSPQYQAIGFLVHPIVVQDAHSGVPLGISSLKIWNRGWGPKRERSKRYEARHEPIEQKESYKWVTTCLESKNKVLQAAQNITFVMDREADSMEVFDRLIDDRSELIIRSRHNRTVIDQTGKEKKLNHIIDQQKAQGYASLQIRKSHKKRKARKTKVSIKYGQITIQWPKGLGKKEKHHPEGIDLNYVEIKEVIHRGHPDEKPLKWVLLTSKPVNNLEEARQVGRQYERRWDIEVFFKLIKSDGYQIESSELETGKAIRKLTIMVMQASIRAQQLKAARSGEGKLQVTDVFTSEEEKCLELVLPTLEGKTAKQQNPYPRDHLSWAAWIIARLGGWHGYDPKRPPGNKTFIWGLEKFEAIMIGIQISKQ